MTDARHLLESAQGMQTVMLSRLEELVSCESPSNAPPALRTCAELLKRWLEESMRQPVQLIERDGHPHLLVRSESPEVLLLGHFDTVWPLGTTAGWPFSVADGIARGPGVFDMKAGIVQLLTAVEVLGNSTGVSVLLTSDEEIGSTSSRELIEAEAQAAGAVLVCEPSADGGAVKVGRKGAAMYRVEVEGKVAHAGLEPWLGVNAGVELAHQLLGITQFAAGDTTVTPTTLGGGTTTNSVPEHAWVDVDVRSWTRVELERVDREMRGLEAHLPHARLSVAGGIDRLPFERELGLKLLPDVQQAAQDIGLNPPDGVRSAGASDGNFTAALGVPTLDGLGAVGAHPHGRGEHVLVDAMPERAALLATLIDRVRRRSTSI